MLLHDHHRARRPRRHHGTSLFPVSLQILTSGLRAPLVYPSTPEGSVDRRLHIGNLSTYLHRPEMEEDLREKPDSPDETARRHIETPRRWSRGGRAGGRPPSSRRKAQQLRGWNCSAILYGGFGPAALKNLRFHGNKYTGDLRPYTYTYIPS